MCVSNSHRFTYGFQKLFSSGLGSARHAIPMMDHRQEFLSAGELMSVSRPFLKSLVVLFSLAKVHVQYSEDLVLRNVSHAKTQSRKENQ